MLCVKCNIAIKRSDDLVCRKCTKAVHYACAGYSEAKPLKGDKTKWVCPDCATPIQNPTLNNQRSESADKDIKTVLDEMNGKMALMMTQLNDTNSKVTSLVEENKALKAEILLKDEKIRKMQSRMDFFDQRLRINNLEISNVPVKTGENVREVVKTLIKAAGYREIQDSDIQATHRVPKFNKMGSNIVVHLTSRWTKAKILEAAKKFKKTTKRNLSSKDVDKDLPDATVYISEHLCPAYKQLLMRTKTFAKNNGYKFVWVHEGRILMKKNTEVRQTYHIQTEEDLSKHQ